MRRRLAALVLLLGTTAASTAADLPTFAELVARPESATWTPSRAPAPAPPSYCGNCLMSYWAYQFLWEQADFWTPLRLNSRPFWRARPWSLGPDIEYRLTPSPPTGRP